MIKCERCIAIAMPANCYQMLELGLLAWARRLEISASDTVAVADVREDIQLRDVGEAASGMC